MDMTKHPPGIPDVGGAAENPGDARRQQALLKSGVLQNAIFHSANFSIIATDEKGIIQLFNPGAERMLGYSAAEVVNKISPSDLHDPAEVIARAATLSLEFDTAIKPGFGALIFKASRGIEDIYELTYIRKDGSRFPAVLSITPLRDHAGDIIGYLLIGTNDAARKQLERELTDAKALAEKASIAKSDFLVQLSYELRTPLNVILGFTQLIESGVPAPAPSQQQNLGQILKAGSYLLELAKQIFELAVIESGKVSLSQEPVSLAATMLESRTMVEPQAKKRSIVLAFPPLDDRCMVRADPTRVKQVLIGLLLNAIKYNRPRGTVRVDVAPSAMAPNCLRVSIRDTGRGLTPEQIKQLFQPFNRLGQEAGDEEGIGIGLVICKQLVEQMGGRLGAESSVGVGSVFWFELSMAMAAPLAAPEFAPAVPAQPPIARGTAPRTVLYVEDNPANLELVRQLFARRPDLRLLTATDATLGMASARANQPALILMDINLPGLSGIDAMKNLRGDPATARIPVIALTANALPGDIERGLKGGFAGYVTKPITIIPFLATLDAALELSPMVAIDATRRDNP